MEFFNYSVVALDLNANSIDVMFSIGDNSVLVGIPLSDFNNNQLATISEYFPAHIFQDKLNTDGYPADVNGIYTPATAEVNSNGHMSFSKRKSYIHRNDSIVSSFFVGSRPQIPVTEIK